MGAAQADMSGKNVLVGALVGGLIGAVSAGVGGWVGGTVTQYLTTTVWIAESATATAAANIVGAMAGGFAGGAVSGGLNAAVYGGNVWQSALYGGLIGAAIAGTLAGAVELNNWVNSDTSVALKDPITGKMYADERGFIISDARELTPGERALRAALKYEGERGFHCNDLVIQGFKDADLPIANINTRNLAKSSYFTEVPSPMEGDIVLWPNRHMGFFYQNMDRPSYNLFHSPGINRAIGFERIDYISNSLKLYDVRYFRYILPK